MTAKQKLETLTHGWYGYAVFAALVSVFQLRASGLVAMAFGLVLSVALNLVALVISFAIIAFFGRSLARRSSGTRAFLVVASAIFTLLGVLGTLAAGWDFLRHWSLAHLAAVVLSGACTMMNARSFNVLTDRAVKAYFQ